MMLMLGAEGKAMLRTTLTLAAIYLAAVGLGLMLFPLQFGIGAVPPDASPQLIALLRLLGGPFLGIALLNWLSRNDSPYRSVLIANIGASERSRRTIFTACSLAKRGKSPSFSSSSTSLLPLPS
jgi:hypothetical protein